MTQRAGSAVREAEALRPERRWPRRLPADGRAQLSGLEAQSQAVRTRLEEVGRELEQLQERRQTEESAAAENRKALEEAREEAAAAENVIQGHGLKMGGRQRPGRRKAPAAGAAEPSGGGHGGSHPPADGDGEGVRGLFPCGEAGDAGGGQGRPAGRTWPGGQPHDHAGAIHRGHRDRLGRRPAKISWWIRRTMQSPPSAT